MTNAPPQPEQQPSDAQDKPYIITLEGEDGSSHQCQIIDIIPFEGKEYGLLLKLKDEGADDAEEESLVIMRLLSRDEQSIFRTIESDEEFEKVLKYVEQLAREAAEIVESEE